MRRRGVAAVLALSLIVGASPALAPGQQPQTAPEQALANSLYSQLAALRGQAAPGPPPPVVIRSQAEIRRYAEQELNRKYPPARLEAERKGMVAWGLIAADFDLRGMLLDLLQEQAAAYYDPVAKVMVLAATLTPEQQHVALLHELVHALQDREVPLDRFLAPGPGKGDQILARQTLVEGDATALSLDVLLTPQGLSLDRIPDLSLVRQLISLQTLGTTVARAPKFLKDLLLFPYIQGLTFVHQFRLRNPWSAIGQLYRDPPRSTTQVLHPDKFFGTREDPLSIALPDLTAILGQKWQKVIEDELGEWSLGAVLEGHLGEGNARSLAQGWRGDRYQLWEDGRDQLLVYRLSLERDGAAEVFALAYARLIEKKYPVLAGKGVRGPDSVWSWQVGPQGLLVERRGQEILVLERAPAGAMERIRQALWSASAPVPTR